MVIHHLGSWTTTCPQIQAPLEGHVSYSKPLATGLSSKEDNAPEEMSSIGSITTQKTPPKNPKATPDPTTPLKRLTGKENPHLLLSIHHAKKKKNV
jgi:hypothetical protein